MTTLITNNKGMKTDMLNYSGLLRATALAKMLANRHCEERINPDMLNINILQNMSSVMGIKKNQTAENDDVRRPSLRGTKQSRDVEYQCIAK